MEENHQQQQVSQAQFTNNEDVQTNSQLNQEGNIEQQAKEVNENSYQENDFNQQQISGQVKSQALSNEHQKNDKNEIENQQQNQNFQHNLNSQIPSNIYTDQNFQEEDKINDKIKKTKEPQSTQGFNNHNVKSKELNGIEKVNDQSIQNMNDQQESNGNQKKKTVKFHKKQKQPKFQNGEQEIQKDQIQNENEIRQSKNANEVNNQSEKRNIKVLKNNKYYQINKEHLIIYSQSQRKHISNSTRNITSNNSAKNFIKDKTLQPLSLKCNSAQINSNSRLVQKSQVKKSQRQANDLFIKSQTQLAKQELSKTLQQKQKGPDLVYLLIQDKRLESDEAWHQVLDKLRFDRKLLKNFLPELKRDKFNKRDQFNLRISLNQDEPETPLPIAKTYCNDNFQNLPNSSRKVDSFTWSQDFNFNSNKQMQNLLGTQKDFVTNSMQKASFQSKHDWYYSSLNQLAKSGLVNFNWERLNSVFREQEVQDLIENKKMIYNNRIVNIATRTIEKLREELDIKYEESFKSTYQLLKRIKFLIQLRKNIINTLYLINLKECQIAQDYQIDLQIKSGIESANNQLGLTKFIYKGQDYLLKLNSSSQISQN